MSKTPLPTNDRVAEQAIEWLILLKSGTATAEDSMAFDAWRNADVRHETACSRIEKTLSHFACLDNNPYALRSALLAPSIQREALTDI